jgi:hypothetical protein
MRHSGFMITLPFECTQMVAADSKSAALESVTVDSDFGHHILSNGLSFAPDCFSGCWNFRCFCHLYYASSRP